MSTIPGVTITTNVVNQNPRGNSDVVLALVGACEKASAIATPLTFTTYSQAVAAIGSDTTNGDLIGMIYAAFNNGAQSVVAVVVATSGAKTASEYTTALASLATVDGISAVVVEDTTAPVAAVLETSCDTAATGYRFRRGYCGMPAGSIISDYPTRAATLANPRMFLVGPNFKDSSDAEVAGGVQAAAMAMVAEKITDPSKPITGQPINGFNGTFLSVTDANYDTLHNGGVYTATSRGTDSVMRYLTTEIAGDTAIKEGTISKVRDYVMANMKTRLEAEFRGAKLTATVLKQVEGSVKAQLLAWQSQTIIDPDNAITVVAEVDATDKTKINVTASYYAIYPLNFIDVTMTLNL